MEIDHEIIFTIILLHSADSRRVVVSSKRKYVHEVLVNCLVKLAQEKVWLGELTVLTIAVDLEVRNQTKTNQRFRIKDPGSLFQLALVSFTACA